MIRVENVELLHRLHMTYWVGGQERGPTMAEMLNGEVWYDPRTGVVWFEDEDLLFVERDGSLASEMIRDGILRCDLDVPMRRGSLVWLELSDADGGSGVGMCLGEGVWLMEDGLEVWFWEILDWKGVEVSQLPV